MWSADGKYCFSDGVGRISLELAQEVYRSFESRRSATRRKPLPERNELLVSPLLPSAFQIRFGGVKGVISVDSRLPGKRMIVRDSMVKFDSTDTTVEVCTVARASPAFLNRQILALLSCRSVPDVLILQILDENLDVLLACDRKDKDARAVLLSGCGGDMHAGISVDDIADVIDAGFSVASEPFLSSMLAAVRASQLGDIKDRGRVFVPKGATLMGVMDESGVLEEDEVYFACTGRSASGTSAAAFGADAPWLRGAASEVTVTKCPCLHPGDLRVVKHAPLSVLKARDLSCESYFAHLHNVLVFSQKGVRPLPNQCSGSDLDGDVYFATWDDRLRPLPEEPSWDGTVLRNPAPMDYTAPTSIRVAGVVSISQVQEFFVNYMRNDKLGAIANAHCAQADIHRGTGLAAGARHATCLELAKQHSIAVDFAKTGVPADVPRDCWPKEFPHFMERRGKPEYLSNSVTALIYDRAVAEISKVSAPTTGTSSLRVLLDLEMEVPGWTVFTDDAQRDAYDYFTDLISIMHKFGVRTEGEALSGHVQSFRSGEYCRVRVRDAREAFSREMRDIVHMYRQRFIDTVLESAPASATADAAEDTPASPQLSIGNLLTWKEGVLVPIACQLASAWYAVTYDDELRPNLGGALWSRGLLSFPWLVPEVMTYIKRHAVANRKHVATTSGGAARSN